MASAVAKKVVIIGGGFAGLSAAKELGNKKEVSITLVDRRNHHLFQPLLYQVAMAGLSPAEIAAPIRSVLSSMENTEVILAQVDSIDLDAKVVRMGKTQIVYDYLIVAGGAYHSYFGHEQWEKLAPGLKTIEQATEIRRRVLLAFEKAETETDLEEQKSLLTFVVVGGGATGVELAGAIGEISKYTLALDFRKIDPNRTRIILVEAGNRILKAFDPELSRKASRSLEALGVQIWTSSMVTKISEEGVYVGDEFLGSRTVLWAAGVRCSKLSHFFPGEKDSIGRVKVESDLTVSGYPHTYVVGDQCLFIGEDGKPLPGLAPVAMQEGKQAARNILREIAGKPKEAFYYFDKGQLATIGRRKAVLEWRFIKLHGFLAWLIWLFVHIYYLIGFKNKFFVFVEWAWHYLSYRRGARLILGKEWQMFRDGEA
ncbi:MAG: NAD(P)/FAD-dependent oxidoreductase [Oligoflexales bacterium]